MTHTVATLALNFKSGDIHACVNHAKAFELVQPQGLSHYLFSITVYDLIIIVWCNSHLRPGSENTLWPHVHVSEYRSEGSFIQNRSELWLAK